MNAFSPPRTGRNAVSPAWIGKLERALRVAAQAVEYDPDALPIFARIDRELAAARLKSEVRAIDCPIERARALLKGSAA